MCYRILEVFFMYCSNEENNEVHVNLKSMIEHLPYKMKEFIRNHSIPLEKILMKFMTNLLVVIFTNKDYKKPLIRLSYEAEIRRILNEDENLLESNISSFIIFLSTFFDVTFFDITQPHTRNLIISKHIC